MHLYICVTLTVIAVNHLQYFYISVYSTYVYKLHVYRIHLCSHVCSCVFTLDSVDGGSAMMSNEMIVKLPLDTEDIRLPGPHNRPLDDERYHEYIEVRENREIGQYLATSRWQYLIVLHRLSKCCLSRDDAAKKKRVQVCGYGCERAMVNAVYVHIEIVKQQTKLPKAT